LKNEVKSISYTRLPGSHKKHDIILRFENQRYTLLHAIEGATADQSMQSIPRKKLTLLHETNKMVQCQDMRTFDEFFDANFFLSAALEGSEPNEHELDSMWKEAVDAAGLQYEETSEKWLTFPAGLPPATLANVDGSLRGTSWKQLQQALLSALESDAASCDATLRPRTMRSPPRAVLSNPRPNLGDVTFMDAGSESGKGLYRMMSDKRITHEEAQRRREGHRGQSKGRRGAVRGRRRSKSSCRWGRAKEAAPGRQEIKAAAARLLESCPADRVQTQ
jgi:hypothetical protein